MYGFHKLKGARAYEFRHPFFRRDHKEYLCHIKRRYAHSHASDNVDASDNDISPSKYYELQQQLIFLSEKVEGSTREIERLKQENTKLQVRYRELNYEDQKSVQKALIVLLGVLNEPTGPLPKELHSHLRSLNIDIEELTLLTRTFGIEHLIEQNYLNKLFKTDDSKHVLERLLGVFINFNDRQRAEASFEAAKDILLKRIFSEISQKLVVPHTKNSLTLNIMDDVVETRAHSIARKSESSEDLCNN